MNHHRKCHLFFFVAMLCSCFTIPSAAQYQPDRLRNITEQKGSPLAQYKKSTFTQYTEQDGLPGAEVDNLLIDKLGYVWTGTVNGLARFDGYEFKRFYYNPNDTASIQGLIVWSMLQDRKDNIWIGTSPMFLNRYEPGTQTFQQYKFTQLVNRAANTELAIRSMAEDDSGRIYFGVDTYYGDIINPGILYKNENEDQLKALELPAGTTITNVYRLRKDRDGNIWALAYNGIFIIDKQGKVVQFTALHKEFGDGTDAPNDIAFTKDGHAWILSQTLKLFEVDTKRATYTKWFSKDIYITVDNSYVPKTIVIDKDENFWLGTNGGLQHFDRKTKQFSMVVDPSKKQFDHISLTSLAQDTFGTLWLGSLAGGLVKYEDKTLLRSYSYNKDDNRSISGGWASYIYEGPDGRLWIVTNGSNAGITIYDPISGSIQQIPYTSMQPVVRGVNCIWQNAAGKTLFGSYGILEFSEKDHRVSTVKLPGLGDSLYITFHYEDTWHDEWIGSFRGLYKKEKGTDLYKLCDLGAMEGNNASSNEVMRCIESSKYGLWFITNAGLFLYDHSTGKFERHGFDKKKGDIFLTQDINSFYEDSKGIVWVGTWQGGLSRYDVQTKKIKTYTRNDGLPSMSIQSIVPDEKNNCLWLSTFEGLSRFNFKTEQFNNFSISDGIQSQMFADGSALKTSTGLIVFGGSNGITVFNPDEVDKNSIPPRVFLTDIKVSGRSIIPGKNSIMEKPVYETSNLTLSHAQNNLSFEFTALHYSNPPKNRYSYKLENYDNDWREVGNQHSAFYSNLPPGQYTFLVKAANDKGVWSGPVSLHMTINPPWWRTITAYITYLLVLLVAGFAVDRYIRRRIRQKELEKNRLRELEHAKEIERAYHRLEESHEVLKATQSQLVQAEKMASLGELTAGIAHEIQNPLNFVNNFSEVNSELISEMVIEVDRGNVADAKTIANDIKQNLEKINHHGKRADAIVKGMLQHSRVSTGQKELTDINALADEYLRLAYHGFRAKDTRHVANKSFNVSTPAVRIETNFDNTIGKINVVPQDIGRVLLNLINNAFYTVNEKVNIPHGPAAGYEPVVSVTTKKTGNTPGNYRVEIKVSDNGNGIPKTVIDKIFQPFFTTKPTGQGTGLGLSLAYDIITKGHGGEIKVETKEGEGSTFTIKLPV